MEIIWVFFNAHLEFRQLQSWNKHKLSMGKWKKQGERKYCMSCCAFCPPFTTSPLFVQMPNGLLWETQGFHVEIQTGFETTAAVDFPHRSPVQIITRLSLFWPLIAHNDFVIIVSWSHLEGLKGYFKWKIHWDALQQWNLHSRWMVALLVDTHSL